MEPKHYRTFLSSRKRQWRLITFIGSSVFLLATLFTLVTLPGQAPGKIAFDAKGFLLVFGGTIASLLFQFDIETFFGVAVYFRKSLRSGRTDYFARALTQLDEWIVSGKSYETLRPAEKINGEFVNDVLFLHKSGLLVEEIETLMAARIKEELERIQQSARFCQRAVLAFPAFGLFGTVLGLIGVLRTLGDPSQMGPSMSLALMTTAYGAACGTILAQPLAGRLEQWGERYLSMHEALLERLKIILQRRNRDPEDQLKVAA